jgi:hypothetical protein
MGPQGGSLIVLDKGAPHKPFLLVGDNGKVALLDLGGWF